MSVYVRNLLLQFHRNENLLSRSTVQVVRRNEFAHQSKIRYVTTLKSFPKPAPWKSYTKLVSVGLGIGAAAGGGYLYQLNKKINTPESNSSKGGEYVLQEQPPTFKPARVIHQATDNTGLKITLFQYQTCPFCCKVRAYLDFYGFSYNVIEVNSVTRAQTKWTSYRKVPFVVIEMPDSDTILQLKDSSMIISILQSFLENKNEDLVSLVKCYPTTNYTNEGGDKCIEITNRYFLMYGQHPPGLSKEDIIEERKWRKWVDDVFVHVLSPNVYRTPEESLQAFKWFSKAGNWEENFAKWEQLLVVYVGAVAMFFIGKRLKSRHHLKDDVRLSFYDETNVWLKALEKKGTKFMGGDEPNLSDLAVYGVLTAVEGCNAFQDLQNNTKITPWFEGMTESVKLHSGSYYTAQRGNTVQA